MNPRRAPRHTRAKITLSNQRMMMWHKLVSWDRPYADFPLESVCRSHGISLAEGSALLNELQLKRELANG